MVIARTHVVATAGAALYCAGLLTPLSHTVGHVSVPLRMAGLILLGWGAWRQRSCQRSQRLRERCDGGRKERY